jgi:hypothetical protein
MLIYNLEHMENTQSIYVESVNETWQMPDDLALKLTEYKNEHPEEENNPDALHLAWYATLSSDDQAKIDKQTPQE